MKKRLLFLALALALCLSLLPGMALAANDTVNLEVTVRDFKLDGILFDGSIGSVQGLVEDRLGADKKPVFHLPIWQENYGDTITQEKLNAFFNDVSGYNMSTKKTLTMNPDPYADGYWVIDSSVDENGEYQDGFFPIDNELFGNEEYEHNYHFSVEIHTKFKYVQGAEFEFSGDDDVWVFFNNKLVMDVGGIHGAEGGTISMAEIADDLGVKVGDVISFDMFYMERCYSGSNMYIRTNFDFLNLEASAWAQAELAEADALGLIPEVLAGANLTKPITRAEFAAVAVKVYETLSGVAASPVADNPFADTADPEVLKAYRIGAVNGTSATTYDPDVLLNREQAATMLTRVFKAAFWEGWTLAGDGSYTAHSIAVAAPHGNILYYNMAETAARTDGGIAYTEQDCFVDDQDISGWAKDSVYFMAANGIINGVGNNTFAPRAVTSAQQAEGYAQATREQALLIAVRMVKNLSAA